MKINSFIPSSRNLQKCLQFSAGLALIFGLNTLIDIQTVHAAPPPKLRVVGNHFQDPAGNTVILRGVSLTDFQHVEEAYGYKFMIDLLTNAEIGWHTKVIRVPIHPDRWHNGNREDKFNRYLKPLVDYATQKGLYVIIDWHYIADPRKHQQETLEFWKYIAPKFASYGNVSYELFNELRGNANDIGLNWNAWKATAQPWINAIRAAGAPNILLMCSPHYCQHTREAGTDPFYDPMFPNQPNIAYISHVYPGYYSRGSHLNDYDYELKPVLDRFPVVITEWGWDRDFSGNEVAGDLASYGNRFKEYVDKNKLSWTSWVANKDGWFPQLFDSAWNPRPSPRYHGTFTRDWLYEKRNSNQPQESGSSASAPQGTDSPATPSRTQPSSPQSLLIDTGSSTSYKETAGKIWSQDQGYVGGSTVERGDISIANTSDDKLYQTERYGMNSYAIKIPNGTYKVTLHFAETYSGITAKDQRVFDVDVEGKSIPYLDVFTAAGGRNIALTKSVTASISDGQLDIRFTAIKQKPMINAIEVTLVNQ